MKYVSALIKLSVSPRLVLGFHKTDDAPVVKDPNEARVVEGLADADAEAKLNNDQWVLAHDEVFIPMTLEDALNEPWAVEESISIKPITLL